jgi:hypothetical protein
MGIAVAGAFGAACNDNQQARALAIGLNSVDPNHYNGWSGNLTGCEPDARDMTQIASAQNFKAETLLTSNATRNEVLRRIRKAAAELKAGDVYVLSYSGHGGQLPDANGDEADMLDETWCLYDGQLIDDELHAALAEFKPGVRILVFSDSCHSGTVIRMMPDDFRSPPAERINELRTRFQEQTTRMSGGLARKEVRRAQLVRERGQEYPVTLVDDEEARQIQPVIRAMDPITTRETYRAHAEMYDKLGKAAPREDKVAVRGSVILISGCEDNQVSADIGTNGLFTLMLKNVWDNGNFQGDHHTFHRQIRSHVMQAYAQQQPYYFKDGTTNIAYEKQRPYTIEVPRTKDMKR